MVPSEVDHALSLPADDAVVRLLELPENQWFERKSGSIKPTDLAVPLIAMANAEGGVVVAGLAGGDISPVSDRSSNELRQAAVDFTRPPVRIRIQELATTDGRVLIFHVGPGGHVHETAKGECFQRIGDESRRLSYSQRQQLEWDRGVASFDGSAVPKVRVSDLSKLQLTEFQSTLGSSSPEHALGARDLILEDGELTVASYLLFADRPQLRFPHAHVRVLRYAAADRGTGRTQNLEEGADIRCEGSLPNQIAQATKVIDDLMPKRRVLTGSGRFSGTSMIPKDVWLEGLVNAVIHRSYSIGGDHIRVEIFPNRVEITSPGRFPGTSDPTDPESISRNARNPRVARVCADLGITQELGEGIRRMFNEMRRVGLSEPIYLQTPEAVRLTLLYSDAIPSNIQSSLGTSAMRILDVLRQAQRELGTGQISELVGLTRPTVLRHLYNLRDAKLIEWEGESAKDPRATWRLT